MPSTVDLDGVTLTSGGLIWWVSHEQIEQALPNFEQVGGVLLTDPNGLEWVLDAYWLGDYWLARRALLNAMSSTHQKTPLS